MIHALLEGIVGEARDLARRDLELERVEKIAGVNLSAARQAARAGVKVCGRKITTVQAAVYYRQTGKWAGGPKVPNKIKAIIRDDHDRGLASILDAVKAADAWADQVWK